MTHFNVAIPTASKARCAVVPSTQKARNSAGSPSKKGKTAPFTLDGSASYDPEGGVLSYLWTEAGQMVGTGEVVQVQRAKGVYTFALNVTDDHGAVSSDIVVVTIVKSHDS